MTLAFGGGDDGNSLREMYHKDRAITKLPARKPDQKLIMPDQAPWDGHVKELTICADRLIIHGDLSVPETNVTIFARELIFEDDDAGNRGRITTSPLEWEIPKARSAEQTGARAEDGAHGRKAGDITVYLKCLKVDGELCKRFILEGGKGQDAGEGMPGTSKSYSSVTSSTQIIGSSWPFTTKKKVTATFKKPATYIKQSFWDGSLGIASLAIKWKDIASFGTPSNKPTSALPGKAPGTPGSGGDGGQFESNLASTKGNVTKTGGIAGAKAKDVGACSGGSPASWAHYEVFWYYTAPNSAKSWCGQVELDSGTTTGTSALPAPSAATLRGKSPAPFIKGSTTAWLHPYLVQTVLQYARDAYLADEIEETEQILSDYLSALHENGGQAPPEAGWVSNTYYDTVKTEMITLLHQIGSHLDYFGNPAGWTPLFSLQAHMQMYDNEVDTALQTLLMTTWIIQEATQKQNAAKAMAGVIANLNDDTKQAVNDIETAEDVLARVGEEIASLEADLLDMQDALASRREQLRVEAANNELAKARINFAAQTLSAICTVVPVGQPVTGAVGSLAPIIARHVTSPDSDALDTVGAGFTTISKWMLSGGQDGFNHWAAQVKQAAQPKDDQPTTEEKAANAKADTIAHVGKNIAPALRQIGEAIQGLKVTDHEVEAELERLAAESPEYAALIVKISKLNSRKAEFVQTLEKALQTLADAFGQITANFVTIATLAQQRNDTLTALNHQALLFVQDIEQRAKERLVKYQYYLIRAYESAVFKPYDNVEYRLSAIFDKITELVKGSTAYPGDANLLKLRPVFRGILDAIEAKLKEDFRTAYTYEREYRLSLEQTPEIITQLNREGKSSINLMYMDHNVALIPPKKEQVKITGIKVKAIELQAGAADSGSIELTFLPLGDGTIRSDGHLYVVRHPANSGMGAAKGQRSQLLWGTNYSLSDGEMREIKPSEDSLNLLGYLIRDPSISKERLAKPAAWADIEINLDRPLGTKLKSVLVEFAFQFTAPTFEHHTLDIRTADDCAPLIVCDTKDVTGRTDGFGKCYRIYPRSSNVTLTPPAKYGQQQFSHWNMLDLDAMEETTVQDQAYHVPANKNLRLICIYTAPGGVVSARATGSTLPERPEESPLKGHLRDKPSITEGELIGCIPVNETVTRLATGSPIKADGYTWRKVDFKGIVGWIVEDEAN